MAVRIAHFTDLHFTENPRNIAWSELLSKRLTGWANLVFAGRYKALDQVATITEALLKDLERIELDSILFTGDVTSLSLPSEFEQARKVLDPLFGDDRVTGIPGNHDVYVKSLVSNGAFDKWFGEWVRTDLQRDQLPEEFRGGYPYPLLRYLGSEVVLLCLNDVRPNPLHDSSGKVSEVQLQALEYLLDLPEVKDRTCILALHYGLLRGDGSRDSYFHRLRNAEVVLSLAEENKVDLIVHGHLHRRFVHPRGSVSSIAIANPGAVAYKNSAMAYHIYTVDCGEVFIETRHYDSERAEFKDWPDAPGNGKIS